MFRRVQSTIGKVFHEVLLEISKVFFMEPCILHKDKVFFLVKPFLIQETAAWYLCTHLTSASRWSCCGASFLSSCRIDNTWNITDMASGVSRWALSVLFQGESLALASIHTSSRRGTSVAAKLWTASAESRPSPNAGPGSTSGLHNERLK